MYFLWNPLNWLSGIAEELGGTMLAGIRTLSFSLSTHIYKLIIDLYNLFEILCTARLLDSSALETISTRIGLVLGILMFFNVTLSFIKMLIEPDSFEDKEKGAIAIIKKTLIVIVMLGVSNFAFNTLYRVQRTVIKNNVISKLILPYKVEAIEGDEPIDFGTVLSKELIFSFYQLENFDNAVEIDTDTQDVIDTCTETIKAFNNQVVKQNRFDLGYNCLNDSVVVKIKTHTEMGIKEQEIFMVAYNWLLCPLVGLFVVYLLFMYVFKIGVRMVQLTVLEIISPMAAISYLSPKKETMFNKWWKVYFATYIDVFIRMAIISFVVFLIAVLFSGDNIEGAVFWQSVGNPNDFWTRSFFKVVMILALLTFAKKAPDLIKELLPASASKLGFGASMKDIVGLQKGINMAAGVAGGAAIGLLAGRPLGAIGGALKGGISGFSGKNMRSSFAGAWKAQSKANKTMADVRANGGSWFGHQIAQLQQGIGMHTAADRYNEEKGDLEKENSLYNQFSGYYDAAKKRAESKILDGKLAGNSNADAALAAKRKMDILQAQAGNLDRSAHKYQTWNSTTRTFEFDESKFNADLNPILDKINAEQKDYNDYLKAATKDYMSEAVTNPTFDPVINQNMSMAQSLIDNNSNYGGFAGSGPINSFDSFDTANNLVKTHVTENTSSLARNARTGKSARANAGK